MDRTVDRDTGWKMTFAGTMLIVAAILAGLAFTALILVVGEGRRVSPGAAQQPAPPVSQPAPPSVPAVAPAAAAPTATASPVASPTAVASAAVPAREPSTPAPTATAQTVAPGEPSSVASPTGTGSSAGAQSAATGDAAAGGAAFGSLCAGCHPKGGAGVGPDLHGLSGDTVTATVRTGKGMMPPFGADRIPDKQMLDILAYLGTLN